MIREEQVESRWGFVEAIFDISSRNSKGCIQTEASGNQETNTKKLGSVFAHIACDRLLYYF